ncbi:hypothetical protein ACOMHN_040800 [Nucella lapillus]
MIIADDLKWHTHIASITKKANSTLGFLRRNLRNCPQASKKTAYTAFVRPILEYAGVVWDPHYEGDTEKLKIIQHRAARFIKGDYKTREPGCVTAMLADLELQSLQDRHRDQRLSYLNRVVEGSFLPPDQFIKQHKTDKRRIQPKRFKDCVSKNIIERKARKNSRTLEVPPAKTEQFRNYFFVRTVTDWNNLSEEQVQTRSKHQPRHHSIKRAE